MPSSLRTVVTCLLTFWGHSVFAYAVLESPACIDQYKQPSAAIRDLSALLKDNRLKSFYMDTKKHALTFRLTTRDNVDTELKEKIWICYLVASAPVFSLKTYRETEPDVYMDDDMADINRKSEICLLMEKYIGLVHGAPQIKEPVKKQIIQRLLLPYYACIIKQFKNGRERNPYRIAECKNPLENLQQKGPAEKLRRLEIEKLRHMKIEDLKKLINDTAVRESFIKTRNDVFGNEVRNFEQSFMEILVSVFPGQYARVVEFLQEAGYAKEEIPALIDRTVGRNNKTDFLYKGKHRLEHDRLLKKKN